MVPQKERHKTKVIVFDILWEKQNSDESVAQRLTAMRFNCFSQQKGEKIAEKRVKICSKENGTPRDFTEGV